MILVVHGAQFMNRYCVRGRSMIVSRSIDAGIVHGFRSISATRSEIPLGRGFEFGLGILFDSERSSRKDR